MGAGYWRQLAGLEQRPTPVQFRDVLICPDDDAPLDWLETAGELRCPHCSRAFPSVGHYLPLNPTNESYALTADQRLELDRRAPDLNLFHSNPQDRFGVLWNHLAVRTGSLGGKRVLDLGCGTGWAACWFAAQGAQVVALDAVSGDGGLGTLSEKASDLGLTIDCIQGDLSRLPFVSESMDLVFSACVLAWQRRPERLAKEIGRVLKPTGLYLSLGEPVGDLPEECRDPRRPPTATNADYIGILREGGMRTETVLADTPAPGPKKPGLLQRARLGWRAYSSKEERLFVGQVAPDIQLPEIRWGRAPRPVSEPAGPP